MPKSGIALATLAMLGAFIASPAFAQGLITGPGLSATVEGFRQAAENEPGFSPWVLKREVSLRTPPEREYLVDFRVDVDDSGAVENIRVLGGMYDEAFLGEASAAMQSMELAPATQGGKAVAWTALDFRVLGRGPFLPGMTDTLREEYTTALQLVTDANYADAESTFMALQKDKASRLFEYALLQDQLATIYMATDRMHEGLEAARNATGASEPIQPPRAVRGDREVPPHYLPPELYLPALRRRFLLAVSLNQIGEAIEVFSELQAMAAEGQAGATVDLVGIFQQMESAVSAEAPIGSIVKIIDGRWRYETSSRRIFGVTALNGSVDFIDIACDGNAKRRMAYTDDSEFALPASWDNCTLEFRGEDGSQLTLYEYLN